MNFIDLTEQRNRIRTEISTAIEKVVNHGKFIMGPEVTKLESQLSDYVGAKYCISCGNGTDALQLSLMALGIGPGDEIITTTFSFMATSEVIVLLGAKPVFVDIEPDTYLIDPNQVKKAITKKTKVIIAVSLYGLVPDFQKLEAIVGDYNICIIEDGAQSFGATLNGIRSGNLSRIATTSFFPSKPLGCYGDGGAVFTSDENIANAVRELRIHGQAQKYFQSRIGVNSRLDTMQAAILLEKLKIFPHESEQRQIIADRYNEKLKDYLKIPITPLGRTHAYGQFTIATERRDELRVYLQKRHIPSTVYYPILLHEQKAIIDICELPPATDKARWAAQSVLSLPMSPYLSKEDQNTICDTVRGFFE